MGSEQTQEKDDLEKADPAQHNEDVEAVIKAYCQFPHPQKFALMLTGQWGSGKTTFIERITREFKASGIIKEEPIRVSLYGVSDVSEISAALFQQVHPLLAHKGTQLGGVLARSLAKKFLPLDVPDVDLSWLLKGAKGRVVVFDDFERALLPPAAILGFINPMVEHDDCKVIVVANEEKITDREDFDLRKEKTIGRTLEYLADADAAFPIFLTEVDNNEAREYLQQSRELALQVFRDSQLNNLRLLKHAMWDFERLWGAIPAEYRQHVKGMGELLGCLLFSAIELRSGNLRPHLYRQIDISHWMGLQRETPDANAVAAQKIYKKYPTLNLQSTILTASTLKSLVLKGKVSSARIRIELDRHPYFAKRESIPSWRALWSSYEYPRDEHEQILVDFQLDFAGRKFRSEAEIYHVIGLGLMLSQEGLAGWEAETIVCTLKRYISDIYAASEPSADDFLQRTESLSGGAFGLAYACMEDPRFNELTRYHAQQRLAWRRKAYPAVSRALLDLVRSDGEAFLRDVCFTSGGTPKYARVAVLKAIDPNAFAAALLDAPYTHAKEVMMGLSIRYERSLGLPELAEELPWLTSVAALLAEGMKSLPLLAKLHFRRGFEEYVVKSVTLMQAQRSRNGTAVDEDRGDVEPD